MIRSSLSPPPIFSATFYPSSASSLRSSSYSLKTIRTIARCSVSSSRKSPATNGGKLAQVRRSANGPWVRNRATMVILLSRRMPQVPQLRSLPSPVTASARCFQKGYLVRIYRAWSLFFILSMCPSTVHLDDTRPHSPPTLPYESITHTSFIGSTHAIYREADHAPTCVYRLLSFPICQLGSHNIMPSHCSFPDDSLNPPSSWLPPYPRRHVFVAGIALAMIFPLPPNTPAIYCYLSATDDRTKLLAKQSSMCAHNASDSQRNSNPNPSHTHRHHRERCYDYDPPDVARPLS